eukprot:scaffold7543_cov122-Isochrysis_galbana.AAC.3
MEGTDEYGAVKQADPALALRLPSDPALTAAERRQATEMMRMHRRRNRVLERSVAQDAWGNRDEGPTEHLRTYYVAIATPRTITDYN